MSDPLVTLDYGKEAGGFPFSTVSALSSPAQIEVRYTEAFAGLENVNGDGPWTFANGLSNTFRTETFSINCSGTTESFFVQGGLRWQSIRLLTNSNITFQSVGLRASFDTASIDQLPGHFSASNNMYTQIWGLGAKSVLASCVDGGSQPSTWQITNEGALIRGQETAQSVEGIAMSNYTLSFSTKIIRGGTGWRVATAITPYGPYFVLNSMYPESSTFVNVNRTLLPANTLVVGYGWSLVNQTSLDTGPVQYFPLSMTISENVWHDITTSITEEGFQVSINGTHVATVSTAEGEALGNPLFGPPDVFTGTWGFGPFQDQSAYVKGVSVTAYNGTVLYHNDMMAQATLGEYGVRPNSYSICLDGPKRDRLVRIGDFVHTARTLSSSTHRLDYITGVMDMSFAWQFPSGPGIGLVSTAASMGASSDNKEAYFPSAYPLTDYQIFFLVTIGNYYKVSDDTSTLEKYWQQTKLLVETLLGFIDSYSGLMAGNGTFYFTGPVNGTAPSALMLIALNQLIPVANALGDTKTSTAYISAAAKLKTAINSQLWNEPLGTYSLSLSSPGNFSLAGIAFALRSGAASSQMATSSIAQIHRLRCGVGYVSDTTTECSNKTALSPNILGFLLESLFLANSSLSVQDLSVAKSLLDGFWSMMVTQNEYYSGATWEYMYPDGSPGLDLFTSLSHPWGSAPTYVFQQYVLGISAVQPGYATWQFRPLLHGLGLTYAQGVVPTPQGGIFASWEMDATGKLVLVVEAPAGTTGSVALPILGSSCSVATQEVDCNDLSGIAVQGGQRVEIVVYV